MSNYRVEKYPNREAALKGRRISASRMPAIMGYSKWASPYSVWCEMTGRVPDDEANNPIRFRVGHALEPLIGELYEEHTRREVIAMPQTEIQVHAVFPYITCTLDFTGIDHRKGKGCVNGKTAIAQKAEDWTEGCPKDYWVQAQHEMCVTGRTWASLAVLIGNNIFRYVDIDRDNDFIDGKLLPAAHAFWACVRTGIAPAIDGSEATRNALADAYPEDNGSVIELPAEFQAVDDEYTEHSYKAKKDSAVVEYCCNIIKSRMGLAEVAILPGVAKYTWRIQKTAHNTLARVFRRTAL